MAVSYEQVTPVGCRVYHVAGGGEGEGVLNEKIVQAWFRVRGLGFRFWGSGFRVCGLGFRVQSSEFRVQG